MIKAICFDLDGVYFTPDSFKRFVEAMSVNSTIERAEFVLNELAKLGVVL
ncbi:MAG: hypothetical protein QY318_03840 [Candidatus Dojkabacteria bacterium]|nr:MAG: hypothetical protein QY318_03840 [Candidatus Dojkabacteria bacterium]